MTRIHAGLLTATLVVLVSAASVSAQTSVSGVWEGTNYASKVSGPAKVILILGQDGSAVQGAYSASTGVFGFGQGTVSGSTMTIQWTNRSQCKGTYTTNYQLSGNSMTWTFTGQDCLGDEQGYGNATRTSH